MSGQPQQQLTARALLAGCGIGVMLAAANVYTGLKISIIDGGSITAALLGFTIFATFTRLDSLIALILANTAFTVPVITWISQGRRRRYTDRGRGGGADLL